MNRCSWHAFRSSNDVSLFAQLVLSGETENNKPRSKVAASWPPGFTLNVLLVGSKDSGKERIRNQWNNIHIMHVYNTLRQSRN